MLKTMTTDPIAHRAMRDMVLDYMVPDHRPLYDSVVRDLNWFGPYIAQGKMEDLLNELEFEFKNDEEAEKAYDYLPESYVDDFDSVLRRIKLHTYAFRRYSASRRKTHYKKIREREAWIRFFTS